MVIHGFNLESKLQRLSKGAGKYLRLSINDNLLGQPDSLVLKDSRA